MDWLLAASRRLASDGVEYVRIELLARDLGVSKGSFYWHFKDRDDLLAKLLGQWEREEADWLEAPLAGIHSAASRWARFVNRCSSRERVRLEAAIHSWARKDPRVASGVKTIESRRAAYLAEILSETGFTSFAAAQWADMALLIYLGWLDRITRDPEFQSNGTPLSELLSHMVLAASAKSHPSPS